MMKWTHVCPLLGVALFACATGENETPDPLGLATGSSDASGSSDGRGGGAGSSVFGSSGSADGGSATSGSSTGGTFSFSGTSSFAGTSFATAGTSTGGTAPAGGSGGAGGKASGGAGGKASGGAGSTTSAGAGGGGNAMCVGTTIPAKTSWKGSASQSDNAYPPAKVFDGDNGTRWSTGTKQVGGEWLQLDFGEVVTLNEVTLLTNNDDYFRHYELRLSNTSQDFAAPVLKSADGMTGAIVVPLAPAKAGQFLTIRQTGADAAGDIAWWSLHEVSVACK